MAVFRRHWAQLHGHVGVHGCLRLAFLTTKQSNNQPVTLERQTVRCGQRRRIRSGFRKVRRSRFSLQLSERQRLSKNPRTCFEGPFGELLRATGPMAKANPFRFSAKYQDDETDFLYYGYRYYNASTGRWINLDPLEEKGGRNIYTFVSNDPLLHFDPDGRVAYSYAPHVVMTFVKLEDQFLAMHCGASIFQARIGLSFASSVDGWVIQHVRRKAKLSDCTGKPITPKREDVDFYEAWRVTGGDFNVKPGSIDVWGTEDYGGNVIGTITISAKLLFYPDYALLSPPWLWQDVFKRAGGLPTIDSPPADWSDLFGADHILKVDINCCCGQQSTKVVTTPSKP
jgi:RHS repeat-associated protein